MIVDAFNKLLYRDGLEIFLWDILQARTFHYKLTKCSTASGSPAIVAYWQVNTRQQIRVCLQLQVNIMRHARRSKCGE